MFYLLYFKFVLELNTWNSPRCTADLIYQKVDKIAKRHKLNSNYKKTIKETTCCYIVEYWPKDTMVLGGGVKAVICKKNCEIINCKLYQ